MRTVFVLAFGLLLAGAAAAGDKTELKKFTGTWQAESVTVDGKDWDADAVKAVKLVVAGEKYSFTTATETVKGTHRLEGSKTPKEIDATRTTGALKGKTLKGIYELNDDTFKVCFAAPGKDRPA
jgi:uncharacterized protein (TIGR03067 family)